MHLLEGGNVLVRTGTFNGSVHKPGEKECKGSARSSLLECESTVWTDNYQEHTVARGSTQQRNETPHPAFQQANKK